MAKLKILRAMPMDAEHVADNLRHTDVVELTAIFGLQSFRDVIVRSVVAPGLAYVAVSKGAPVCVFGASEALPGVGVPWLLATEAWYSIPKRELARATDYYLRTIRERYALLINYVYVESVLPIAWLKRLGFTFSALPVPHGKYGELFYVFWMRGCR